MPYSTPDDIKNLMGEKWLARASNDAGTGTIDNVVTAAIISDIDAMIDSKLRGRYTVPVVTIDGGDVTLNTEITKARSILKTISANLSAVELHARRFPNEHSEGMKERYDRNMALLNSIQNGQTILYVLPAVVTTGRHTFASNKRTRLFDDTGLKGMP